MNKENKKTITLITGEVFPLVDLDKETKKAIIEVTTKSGKKVELPISEGFYTK